MSISARNRDQTGELLPEAPPRHIGLSSPTAGVAALALSGIAIAIKRCFQALHNTLRTYGGHRLADCHPDRQRREGFFIGQKRGLQDLRNPKKARLPHQD